MSLVPRTASVASLAKDGLFHGLLGQVWVCSVKPCKPWKAVGSVKQRGGGALMLVFYRKVAIQLQGEDEEEDRKLLVPQQGRPKDLSQENKLGPESTAWASF